jgi:MoxR-like ATPase
LIEGEAGVGKTDVARALAGATGARLIRLQCHEGIDRMRAAVPYTDELIAGNSLASLERLAEILEAL